MSVKAYIQINLIPFLAAALLLINLKTGLPSSRNGKLLQRLMVMVMGILLADTLAWVLDGREFFLSRELIWLTNSANFILVCCIGLYWFRYVCGSLDLENRLAWERWMRLASLPVWTLAALLVLLPQEQGMLYIDAQNHYQRGPLFFLQFTVGFGYLLAASALALRQRGRETLLKKKRQCSLLAAFPILPFLGGCLQMVWYGTALLLPFSAAALLLIYLNMQHSQVTLDGLTGLNNRNCMDQYCLSRCQKGGKEARDWFLILLDLDEFKTINDRWGHGAGDAALRQAADALRAALGATDAFLARYGGDEFAVVMAGGPQEARQAMAALQEARGSAPEQPPVGRFSWSMGYACYGEEGAESVESMAELADKRMYVDKRLHKLEA